MGFLDPFRSITGGPPPLVMASRSGILRILSAKGVNTGLTPGLFSCDCCLLGTVVVPVIRDWLLLGTVLVSPGAVVPMLDTDSLFVRPPMGYARASGFQ